MGLVLAGVRIPSPAPLFTYWVILWVVLTKEARLVPFNMGVASPWRAPKGQQTLEYKCARRVAPPKGLDILERTLRILFSFFLLAPKFYVRRWAAVSAVERGGAAYLAGRGPAKP